MRKVRARPVTHAAERERLTLSNLSMVTVIAKHIGKRLPPCFDLDDLKGPGFLGLWKAARKFSFKAEPGDSRSVDVRFRSYARLWIKGSIQESVRRKNWAEATAVHLEDLPAAENLFVDPRQHPEELVEQALAQRNVNKAIAHLRPLEQTIVRDQLLKGTDLQDIAKVVEITPTRAGELRKGAYQQMRTQLQRVA